MDPTKIFTSFKTKHYLIIPKIVGVASAAAGHGRRPGFAAIFRPGSLSAAV